MGDAADKREFIKRLTTFLFQPLLAAERLGEPGVIVPLLAGEGLGASDRRAEGEWVDRLRALGDLWQAALPRLLEGLPLR